MQHLVSVVEGTLRDGVEPLDLLRRAFPGGSVTGVPKIRAMEIIAELEPTVRGPYCGSLGYLGVGGQMDTNILIRTVTAARGWWQIPGRRRHRRRLRSPARIRGNLAQSQGHAPGPAAVAQFWPEAMPSIDFRDHARLTTVLQSPLPRWQPRPRRVSIELEGLPLGWQSIGEASCGILSLAFNLCDSCCLSPLTACNGRRPQRRPADAKTPWGGGQSRWKNILEQPRRLLRQRRFDPRRRERAALPERQRRLAEKHRHGQAAQRQREARSSSARTIAAETIIDNGGTWTQIRFLALMHEATGDQRFADAALRGINFLLEAQYPNGGWPMIYPLRKGYYTHITFNDGAMIGVMNLLRDIAENSETRDGKQPFDFVDTATRERCQQAIDKGLEVILATQVVVDGKPTAWCAQYDEVTLKPAPARSLRARLAQRLRKRRHRRVPDGPRQPQPRGQTGRRRCGRLVQRR